MRLSRYSAWLGLGLGITGLAISAAGRADERIGKIRLEASLPADEAALLKYDRAVFPTFKIPESNSSLKRLLGVSSTSPAALLGWLENRVQVIVGEDFDPDSHLVTLEPAFPFPYPGVFPNVETSTLTPVAGVTIMSNAGEYLYEESKRRGALLGVQIDGAGTIPMTSPRAGIIQVGPGLFSPPVPADPRRAASPANAISRLGTLFHEAHHSDGHGEHLGFLHAICPQGHEMQGWNACDRNLNGPYAVGGRMVQAMTESCAQCTRGQREALRLEYLDYYGRALPRETDGYTQVTAWDPAPEGRR